MTFSLFHDEKKRQKVLTYLLTRNIGLYLIYLRHPVYIYTYVCPKCCICVCTYIYVNLVFCEEYMKHYNK